MKENSRKEDIRILEEMIENANIENMDMNDCFGGEHIEAIEHILPDYKRVLKENEELKSKNKTLEELLQGNLYELYKYYKELAGTYQGNCIPVQEVKDKIEELKQEKKKYGNCLIEMYEDELVNRDIKILQELLEGRK